MNTAIVATFLQRTRIACCILSAYCLFATGCSQPAERDVVKRTDTKTRAERRAFYGAPPVVPHAPQGAACTTCHTDIGKKVVNLGFAPANPHGDRGDLQNCRQCHVFIQSDEQFAANDFQGLRKKSLKGERLFASAPPSIPHPVVMRSNCLACHTGQSARPEILCSHPERVNCAQCHIETANSDSPFLADKGA